MRPIQLALSLTLPFASLALAAPASAQETGFHKMHTLKRVGGKTCFADHTHAGQSPATAVKSVAIKLAINKWVSFTAEEYGRSWGSWFAAWGKAETCTGGNGNWVCEVTARPCKTGR